MAKQKSLANLRKEVEKLEKKNKEIDEIVQLKARSDEERKDLNSKLKKLKNSRKPIIKLSRGFRKHLRIIGKRSLPIAKRIKRSLDNAARNS